MHAQGAGLRVAGMGGVSHFPKTHGHVAYQIEGDDEKNSIQVNFSPWGHTVDLGMGSKDHISF